MPKRTNLFQRLIAVIEEQLAGEGVRVRESVELSEYEGSSLREVDVLLETEVNRHRVRIALECRDHKGRQSKKWIDELHGKYRDLPVDKVVAVSSSGFTKGALEKAARVGIETLTFEAALEEHWAKHFRKLYARFLVHRISGMNVGLEYAEDATPIEGDRLDLSLFIENGAGQREGSVQEVAMAKIFPDAKRALGEMINERAEELLRGPASRREDFTVRYDARDRYITLPDGTRRQILSVVLTLWVEFTVQPATTESRFVYKRTGVTLSALNEPNVTPAAALIIETDGHPPRVMTATGWHDVVAPQEHESDGGDAR